MPSLLHPLAGRHRPHRRRKSSSKARGAGRAAVGIPTPAELEPPSPAYDINVRRMRAAGGPLDEATYTCACGYVFAASVSTNVCCPHCGAEQAW